MSSAKLTFPVIRGFIPTPATVAARKILEVTDFEIAKQARGLAQINFNRECLRKPCVTIDDKKVPQDMLLDHSVLTLMALVQPEINGNFRMFAETPISHVRIPRSLRFGNGAQYLSGLKLAPFVAAHFAENAKAAHEAFETGEMIEFFEEQVCGSPYEGYQAFKEVAGAQKKACQEMRDFSNRTLEFTTKFSKEIEAAIAAVGKDYTPPANVVELDFSDFSGINLANKILRSR